MPGRIFIEDGHIWKKFMCELPDVTNVTIKGLQFLHVFNLSSWKDKFDPGWDRIFSSLLLQLLKLNAFNCEDHYFRIFTNKVGENRSKQCFIAGCQNEAGMHSVTRTKEIWNNPRMANQQSLF